MMLKLVGVGLVAAVAMAQTSAMPELRERGGVRQLFVDGRPFVMLAGELHNSSASSVAYMRPIWEKLAGMNLNTVIGTVSWELVEPEEGRFDFGLVDAQIESARARGMRLVLIWFGTWKNAGSSYVPHWVKADRRRFPPMEARIGKEGGLSSFLAAYMEKQGNGPLSAFGAETMKADARAFAALMRHIRQVDGEHTVVMMQVENEAGLLGDSRERGRAAEEAWAGPVPAGLMAQLVKNRAGLGAGMREVWGRGGYKEAGTWAEVFGGDEWGGEVFMAYQVGRYVEEVARAGKRELALPMYVNAWLGPQPGQALPGQYPSGGPVARMMEVWRAAAPSIDFLAPDIYVEDFAGVCGEYGRSGNALFVPEARDQVGNLFWALGRQAALGWAPFGVEDLDGRGQVAQAYGLLREMLGPLGEAQAEGRVTAILGEAAATLGGYRIRLAGSLLKKTEGEKREELPGNVAAASRAMAEDGRPMALVMMVGRDEFVFVGSNGDPVFEAEGPGGGKVVVSSKDEGRYEKGRWVAGRRMNGDELFQAGLPAGRIGMLRVRVLRIE